MITLALDIVTTAAILFIVSAGLLIVFGVMKIINFAHASFVTVGAYAALVASRLGLPPVLAPALAFLAGGLIGAAAERVVVRRLYGRPLDAILATWGLSIVIGQLVTLAFGREVQFVPAPISGTVGGRERSGPLRSAVRVLHPLEVGSIKSWSFFCDVRSHSAAVRSQF